MSAPSIVSRNALGSSPFELVLQDVHGVTHLETPPWSIENRLNLTHEELSRACVLLDHARHQQYFAASPLRSQFNVGSSVYCGDSRIATGSNAEYGAGPRRAYDEGIHAEEVAIVNALSHHGRDIRVEMVALSSDAPRPSTCCGKCRSLLETYGDSEVVIVSAGAGTTVSMWRLSELFPTNIAGLSRGPAPDYHHLTIQGLLNATDRARATGFTPFSEEPIGRSVAAISADGAIFSLPRVDSLAFYGTSSLRATISAVLLTKPTKLDSILISSRSGLPTGEDRQLLFEFTSLFQQEGTVPVFLHTEGTESVVATTPTTLLPHGFGPKDLHITLAL